MIKKASSTTFLVTSISLLVTLCSVAVGKTIYVDDDAAGANDGSSWENAYNYLQNALADANSTEKPVEIRVAQGIYKPNGGIVAIPEFDWRTLTFQLINSVTLTGGYAGAADPNARDIELYETILSGDLLNNDDDPNDHWKYIQYPDRPPKVIYDPPWAENVFHVVTASGTDNSAVIDGFIVTSGYDDRVDFNFDLRPPETISIGSGAGLYNRQGSPIVNKCYFRDNRTNAGGSGMYNEDNSSPILIDCIFYDNLNGGMSNWNNSSPILTNCTFSGNSGGGMTNWNNSNPTLTYCTFSGNSKFDGGGMTNYYNSSPTLTNCTFNGNSANDGGGMYNRTNSSPILTNCILWSNTPDQMDGSADVSYCDIEGGWPEDGIGIIDVDPLFVDPNNGDYHLKSQAGRYDPNSESWIMDDVTSPCIDSGDPNSPVGDEPEPNGGRINMGAYGGTAEASMSLTEIITIYIQWLGHASVKVWTEDVVVYVDPWLLSDSPHDATAVLVTHSHADHYSPTHIAMVSGPETEFIAPPDVVQQYGSGQTIAPEQTIQLDGFSVTGVAAYNTNKPNHPKSNNWVGFIIELGGKRIYVAGDTDLTDEMKALEDIDVAFLPAGGGYTMNATEAAEATQYIQPQLAIPYHWGVFVGNLNDAQAFAEQAACPAKIMSPGEIISSDDWLE